jgi:hypothetical protein
MPAAKPKIELSCVFCGGPFKVSPFDADRKYCSRACHNAGRVGQPNLKNRKQKVEVACRHCKKLFQVHPYRASTALYCSPSCRSADHTGELAGNWQGGKVSLLCNKCGRTYQVERRFAQTSLYCSKPCHSSAKSSGAKSNFWHGGIDVPDYPAEFNETFKRLIRERDNYTCALCGKYGSDVHHINYVKADTTPSNCVTLCRPCHAKTNSNRPHWQKLLSCA